MADHKTGSDEIEAVHTNGEASIDLTGKDKAAEFLKASRAAGDDVVVTPEEDCRILRKIDMRLLPLLLIVYAMQFLDKTTLSYASVFGLIDDTHLVGQQYSWLGAVVYLAQLVFQPLVALLLVKLPMGKFVTFIVFAWGATLCGMVAATNFGGLMAARFVLGAFEAAIAPAFIAIVQMWYKRSEQTNRIAAWYAMLGVVNTLGSLLTFGLGHIKSPLMEYQVIFLFCGCLTLGIAVIVAIFMPDSPFEARFFNQHEKVVAIERLRANQMGVASRVWKWEHVWESMADLKTWCWFAMIFSISVPSGGISTFGPLIVKTFVKDSFHVILFNMPFGALNVVATLGGAWLATKLKRKGPVLILLAILPIAGAAMLLVIPHEAAHRGALLAAYYMISFYPGITPLIYSWSSQNTAGDTKRKCTTGLLFIGSCVGNVVGPHLYEPSDAPAYHRGLISNLILFIVGIGIVIMTTFYLMFLNKRHASKRRAAGKAADVIDHSMISKKDQASHFEANVEHQENVLGDKAFDDMTDLKNEDFIFVY